MNGGRKKEKVENVNIPLMQIQTRVLERFGENRKGMRRSFSYEGEVERRSVCGSNRNRAPSSRKSRSGVVKRTSHSKTSHSSQKRFRKVANTVIAVNRLKQEEKSHQLRRKVSARKLQNAARKFISTKRQIKEKTNTGGSISNSRKHSNRKGKRKKNAENKLKKFDSIVSRKAIQRRARGNFIVRLWSRFRVVPTPISSFVTGNFTHMRPSSVYGGKLYVGDKRDANDKERLQQLGITHILNATRDIPNYFPGLFTYESVPVDDHESTDLRSHFYRSNKFIHNAIRRGGRVLVHCRAGVSRSVTLCLAYLVAKKRVRLRQAYRILATSRQIICPNPGFLLQLAKYEVKVLKYSTVATLTSPPWNFPEWFVLRVTLPSAPSSASRWKPGAPCCCCVS
eukprot:g473.t1